MRVRSSGAQVCLSKFASNPPIHTFSVLGCLRKAHTSKEQHPNERRDCFLEVPGQHLTTTLPFGGPCFLSLSAGQLALNSRS